MTLLCYEYRVGGRGKRRGFAHVECVPIREDGTPQWDTKVAVPVEDLEGQRCVLCEHPMDSNDKTQHSEFERREEAQKLSEALGHVLDRMGCYPETLETAVEAVYPDYGGVEFRDELIRYARGEK